MTTSSFDIQTIITQAQKALHNAYNPYSRFGVGAALLCADGTIITGCNVENASYGATMCAERVTFFKAISEGKRAFVAIAIVGSDGNFAYPCGMCRQVMSEFGLELQVIVASNTEYKIHTLGELLPYAFTSFVASADTKKMQAASSLE